MKKGKIGAMNLVKIDNVKKGAFNSGKPYKPSNFTHYADRDSPSFFKGSKGYKGNIKNVKCYFCEGYGHLKRDCEKHKRWAIKKGKNF